MTSTHELISDSDDARDAPATAGDFIAQLKRRHARVMAARPEKRPGEFKEEANRFGSYQFVEPELVEATSREEGASPMSAAQTWGAVAAAALVRFPPVHDGGDVGGNGARRFASSNPTN